MAMTSVPQHQRNCVACGRAIDSGVGFCPHCGHDFRASVPSTSELARPKKSKSALWVVAVIAIVVVVGLVLAGVLYVLTLGFGGDGDGVIPEATMVKSAVAGGDKFTFTWVSKPLLWSDASISLSDGSNTKSWNLATSDLDNGTYAMWNAVSTTANLGTLRVNLSITDVAGNGYVNQGDCFTLTVGNDEVFSSFTTYTVTMIHVPSGGRICYAAYQGGTSTPNSSLTASSITNGFKLTFAAMSQDATWSDISILLTDWSYTVQWSPLTTDLDNGTVSRWNRQAILTNLGSLRVNMSIFDLAGNGYVNAGDYFTLTVGIGQSFSSAGTYTVTVMHDPSSAEICHVDL